MSVKTENVEREKQDVLDDLSEISVELNSEEEEDVNEDKLAALKAKMSQKNNEKNTMPVRILEERTRSLDFGIVGSGQAGCIDGNTNLYVSDKGIVSIKNLFYDYLNLVDVSKINVTGSNNIYLDVKDLDLYTISMDPETGEFKKAKILAIWKNRKAGKNKIAMSNGSSLVCSKTHPSLVFRPKSKRRAFFSSLNSSNPLSVGDRLIDSRSSVLDQISSKTYVKGIEITNDISWLLGLYAGDGSNSKDRNEISFYCDNDWVIKKINNVMSNIPHSSVKISQCPGCKKVSVYGLQARLFFESAFNIHNENTYGGTGSKTYTVDVPQCVSSSSPEIRASFVAGLIDSDGTIEKNWCKTAISTVSEKAADQLCCLLTTIGARAAVDIEEAHVSRSGKNHSKIFTIRLSGKLNHGPMLPNIIKQMAHSVKKEKLINWQNSDQKSFATSSVPLTFEEMEYWFKSEGKMKTVNDLSVKSDHSLKMWARGERKLSIPTFNDTIDALEKSEQLKYVKDLSEKLIEISSINQITEDDCEFFDLTVEKYENYLAGNNGFIVTHNSRLAESFHKLGYSALAFNTAKQDLEHINLPNTSKCLLDYGLGGASKDPQIGHEAAASHRDFIAAKINDQLGDCQVFVFCTSLGGGSGGGSIDVMLDIMSSLEKPIVVMTVLPMTNEDAQTKKNTLEALKKLAGYAQQGRIHNLIVVDNAKIETIFKDVGPMNFYKVSNEAIVNPLDVFNTYSSMPSAGMKVMDPMEWTKILIDGSGLSLYGEISVSNYEEDTALAEAVVENLTSGLLAEGFDLKQTKYVGAIFLANERVWDKVPAASINYAMSIVQEHAGTPQGVFRGIYQADLEEDVVKVYSIFSGLALPDSRIEELKSEVTSHLSTLKNKEQTRNLSLNLDTGDTKATSQAEQVREKIKANSSPFSKFKNNLVDKRRK